MIRQSATPLPVARARPHYTGHIMALLRRATRGGEVTVAYPQQNGIYGIHQALVMLDGDPVEYRLLLAPADAPICIHGLSIDAHFPRALSEPAGPA